MNILWEIIRFIAIFGWAQVAFSSWRYISPFNKADAVLAFGACIFVSFMMALDFIKFL